MSLNRLQQLYVRDSSLNLRCESLICDSIITPSTPQKVQTVNQQSGGFSIAVDCGANPSRYIIVNTNTASTVGDNASTFTFQNTNISTESIVLASIISYTGSVAFAGLPSLLVKNIVPGSCTISVMNGGNTALAGAFKIYIEIIETQPYP
jgi:hypothetical protein